MKNHLSFTLIPLLLSIIVSIISCSSHNIDTAGTASEVVTKASISGTLVNGGELQKESMQVALYQVGLGTSTALSKVSLADSLVGSLTTNSGSFKFDSLPAGNYRISVTKDSVTLGGSDGITLTTGQALQITINITIIIQQNITINTINNVTVQNINVSNGVAVKNADGTYTFKFADDSSTRAVSVVVVDGDSTKTVLAQLVKQEDGSYELVIPSGSGISVTTSSSSSLSISSSSSISAVLSSSSFANMLLSSSSVRISSSNMISSSSSMDVVSSSSSVANLSSSSSSACVNTYGTNSVTDCRDGTTYKTVIIGTQTWLAQNLAYLPSVNLKSQSSESSAMYYVYDYDGNNVVDAKNTENYSRYGVLYNYQAALSACPTDWRLSSDDDWSTLVTFAGTSTTLKANSNLWSNGGTTNTDSWGFGGLPSGTYGSGGFYYLGEIGMWKTSSNSVSIWHMYFQYNYVVHDSREAGNGHSVRCLKN